MAGLGNPTIVAAATEDHGNDGMASKYDANQGPSAPPAAVSIMVCTAGVSVNQRAIDLVQSVIATLAAMALSWPFWNDFGYWAVSHLAWYVYFTLGFLLAWYVLYVFIGALHTLFAHDALTREQRTNDPQTGETTDELP